MMTVMMVVVRKLVTAMMKMVIVLSGYDGGDF